MTHSILRNSWVFGENVALSMLLQNRSQPTITYSKLTTETLEQGGNMFKVNNKDTRLVTLLLTLNIFHTLF